MKLQLVLILLVITIGNNLFSQTIFEENFEYSDGDYLTNHRWVNHSGVVNKIKVASSGLTYTGYRCSGIGNSTIISGGYGAREDAHNDFTPITSGDLYVAFMVSVSAATETGDYFLHLAPDFPTSNYKVKVLVKNDGAGNIQFGLLKGSGNAVYTPGIFTYSFNTTYLLIIKYEMVQGDSNDVAKLFINPSLIEEPPDANLTATDIARDDIITAVCLRQGEETYTVQVDGIRVATSWNEVIPVELVSFSASVTGKAVTLIWNTASELNNKGFEVQRSVNSKNWDAIAFVEGRGTSSSLAEYDYTDNAISLGKYYYRLKQIDYDGSYELSNAVEVFVGIPKGFVLEQNYPNPFNPGTTIKFGFDNNTKAELRIYNVLGKEIANLFSETVEAGRIYNIDFNASELASGVYYYKLTGNNRAEIKKMLLLK
jgi:hypothetical protein